MHIAIWKSPSSTGNLRANFDEVAQSNVPDWSGLRLPQSAHIARSRTDAHRGLSASSALFAFDFADVGSRDQFEIFRVFDQNLFCSSCFGLSPTGNQSFVFRGADHQSSVIKREGFDDAPFFCEQIPANNLDAFLRLYGIDEADSSAGPCLFHPRTIQQLIQIDGVLNGHGTNPTARLGEEWITGKGHLIVKFRQGPWDGHGQAKRLDRIRTSTDG